jgi:predicted nucleic acid-binding protein
VGVLDVLASAFGEVFVPAVVWEEVVDARPDAPGIGALRAASWLRVDSRALPDVELGLDAGETAAILLAELLHADLLLIDERAGRIVAEGRGLAVRGTLGVLVRARESGAIAALRPVLDALAAEGFRMSPVLVDEALKRVGEV